MYRIAIVDDEYIVTEGFRVIVKRCDLPCEVVGSAENGRDAIVMIRSVQPDLVFTDIRMPGMNGLDMIEQMVREFPEIDFVVISGYAEFSYAQRALTLGVRDYIEKPLTVEKTKETLLRLLKERERKAGRLQAPAKEAQPALEKTVHPSVELALCYLEQNYKNNIGLNDMAEKAGVTPAYLSSIFKEEIGMSPVKYLTRFRMEKAKELLKEGHKVAVVSVLVGYPDYRYFCEVFKKQEGKTPREYQGKRPRRE